MEPPTSQGEKLVCRMASQCQALEKLMHSPAK